MRRLGGAWHALGTAITAGGLIVFGTNEFGLLGELPAVFLTILAFTWLADDSRSDLTSGIGAGIALGLAIYAKLTVAIALPAVLLVAWLVPASARAGGEARSWKAWLGWCCVGLALPVVAWQLFQLSELSWSLQAWAGVKSRQLAFLMGTQSLSGIGQVQEAASGTQLLLRNIARNAAALAGYFGGWWRLLPALAAFVLAFRLTMASPSVPPAVKRTSLYLACAIGLHLGWWLFLSPTGWYRHLLPAILYATVLGGLLAANVMNLSRRAGAAVVAGFCLSVALIMPAWYPQSGDFPRVFRLDFDRDPRLSALLQTRDEVIELQQDDVELPRRVRLVGAARPRVRPAGREQLPGLLPAPTRGHRLEAHPAGSERVLQLGQAAHSRPVPRRLRRAPRLQARAIRDVRMPGPAVVAQALKRSRKVRGVTMRTPSYSLTVKR